MTRVVDVHVGETLEAAGWRFIDAWRRAEDGEAVDEVHLSFESWETLAKTLTGKRLELLRHLHRAPNASVASLARDLGLDRNRVQEDVDALTAAGLIDRDGEDLRADYDAIKTVIAL